MPELPTIDGIRAVLARFPRVSAAWVFGSVARGTARPDSDLDLAVLLDRPQGPADPSFLFRLSAELERFSPSGRVDVLVLGRQGSVLRHRILSEGQLVKDADPDARMEFEESTIREYLDWKPTHDIAMRSTFAGLRDRFGAPSER
jgi:hypothetical protein